MKTREKIKLTVKELQDIVYDDSENFKVIESNITGTFRHGNENEAVIKRISDGKYFEVYYRDSVKDGCDFCDMNYDGDYEEVFKTEKTIVAYE
jgi:hypothetical protein